MGEKAEFTALVAELEEVEQRRSGSGGFASAEDGARRQHIERQLLALLGAPTTHDERRAAVRLPCDVPVWIHHGKERVEGKSRDLGAGGVFVETRLALPVGQAVEIELERRPGKIEHGLRVRGTIAWTQAGGVGVSFASDDEASERRVRRLMIGLLRERIASW